VAAKVNSDYAVVSPEAIELRCPETAMAGGATSSRTSRATCVSLHEFRIEAPASGGSEGLKAASQPRSNMRRRS
jgi:hypothetical protein